MKAFVMKEIGAVGMMEKRVPTPGPNDFHFDEMERAFEVADKKLDDVVKVLIRF